MKPVRHIMTPLCPEARELAQGLGLLCRRYNQHSYELFIAPDAVEAFKALLKEEMDKGTRRDYKLI